MTMTGETTYAQLSRIAGDYLAGYDISQTFPDLMLARAAERDPHPLAVGVEGYVNALKCDVDLSLNGSARAIRAALLARAEDMAEAFAAEGWLLESAPRFEFSGSLQRAQLAWPSGVVVTPPQEHSIGLKVRLSLARHGAEAKL